MIYDRENQEWMLISGFKRRYRCWKRGYTVTNDLKNNEVLTLNKLVTVREGPVPKIAFFLVPNPTERFDLEIKSFVSISDLSDELQHRVREELGLRKDLTGENN